MWWFSHPVGWRLKAAGRWNHSCCIMISLIGTISYCSFGCFIFTLICLLFFHSACSVCSWLAAGFSDTLSEIYAPMLPLVGHAVYRHANLVIVVCATYRSCLQYWLWSTSGMSTGCLLLFSIWAELRTDRFFLYLVHPVAFSQVWQFTCDAIEHTVTLCVILLHVLPCRYAHSKARSMILSSLKLSHR